MLEENFLEIRRKIEAACKRAGRNPSSITLIAVSKNRSLEQILEAKSLGISDFGENRIQEAEKKIPQLAKQRLSFHMVGHLQSNKAKKAVKLFQMIQSIDSLDIARAIDKESSKIGKVQPILLEVNLAGEETKFGFDPFDLDFEFPSLLELRNLSIEGLMLMPPLASKPSDSLKFFRQIGQIARSLRKKHSVPLPHISMGTSQDFEIAIEEGATMVRIGNALFGKIT